MEGRKNGDVFTGVSVNLSESGVLIETAKQLDPGQQINIRMILPNDEEIIGVGVVVRRELLKIGTFGIAVHWDLDASQRQRIAGIIERSVPRGWMED